MDRLRPLLAAVRPDRALLVPCAVFVGSSYARFDAQPGPGIPAHLVVSLAALLAAAGVNLIDEAWNFGPDARDFAIAGAIALLAALGVAALLVPLSGAAAVGYGLVAVLLGVARRVPIAGLDALGRGLGDVASAIALGPLAVLAGFASQCGHGSTGAAIVGVPVGIVGAGALYVRHFTDPETDLRHERATPVAALGEEQARMGFALFPVLAILALAAVVALQEGPSTILAAAGPLAVLAGIAFRAGRRPDTDMERFGLAVSVVSGIALLLLAAALRLAVR